MTSEGLGEMFEGDSADTCARKFPLVSMGGRAEGLACADPGERTPIGASGNFLTLSYLDSIDDMGTLKVKAKHNNANFDLAFGEDATMQDLCEKIVQLTGVSIPGQKLICCGKQLPKDLTVSLKEVPTTDIKMFYD